MRRTSRPHLRPVTGVDRHDRGRVLRGRKSARRARTPPTSGPTSASGAPSSGADARVQDVEDARQQAELNAMRLAAVAPPEAAAAVLEVDLPRQRRLTVLAAARTRRRSRSRAAGGLQLDPRLAAVPAAVATGGALGDGALPAVGDQGGVQRRAGVEHRGQAQRAGGAVEERLRAGRGARATARRAGRRRRRRARRRRRGSRSGRRRRGDAGSRLTMNALTRSKRQRTRPPASGCRQASSPSSTVPTGSSASAAFRRGKRSWWPRPWRVNRRGPSAVTCATARMPSHLGSSTQPSPSGSERPGVQSIGAIGPSSSTTAA